jgi:hypothetical protein
MMRRTALVVLVFAGWPGGPTRANEFTIDLTADAAKKSETAHAEAAVIGLKPKPRAVLEVKAGDRVKVRWTLTNADAKATVKDVLVHCVVVKEEQAGQAAVPALDKGVAAETALTMDFNPGARAQGELNVVLEKPGAYLLRLETIGAAAGPADREFFAALDLVVR